MYTPVVYKSFWELNLQVYPPGSNLTNPLFGIKNHFPVFTGESYEYYSLLSVISIYSKYWKEGKILFCLYIEKLQSFEESSQGKSKDNFVIAYI